MALAHSTVGQITPGGYVTVGATVTYTYNDGNLYNRRNWVVTNGTKSNETFSGTSNSVDITWSSTCGAGTLVFRNLNTVISTLNVTINPTLATPTGSLTTTQYCRYTTITRNGTPPTGELWYWQATSGGMDFTNSTANFDITTSGSYYLRAYACGSWSTNSLGTVHTVVINPAASTGTNGSRCGTGTVAISATPGSQADNIRWYNAASGGTLLSTGTSYTTPSISSTTSYYAASLHTATNCESLTRTQVTATVYPIPDASASGQTICSGQTTSVSISNPNGVSGTTFSWTVSASGVSGASNGSGSSISQTLTTTAEATGTVTYTITPSTANCNGTPINTVVTVQALGTPSGTFSTTEHCRYTTLTRNGTPPSGVAWYWQISASGTSTTNSGATYDITASGFYYLRAYGCGTWSTNSLSTGHISGPIDPAAPSGTSGSRCGTGTVGISATPGSQGDNIRWYSASTGGTALATNTSYTTTSISSTTVYYAASLHTATNCESLTRTAVTATVNPVPDAGASGQTLCSGQSTSIAITNPNGVSGTTFAWTVAESGISGASSGTGSSIADTLTVSSGLEGIATYTITPTVTASGCSGSPITAIARVTTIPAITVTGPNPIVNGTPTQLSTNASYYSFQWKNAAGTDISGQTADTFTVPYLSTFKVNVRSSSGSAWCLSSGTVVTAALSAQGTSVGLVSTTSIFKEGVADAGSLYLLDAEEVAQVNQYSDGLGRVFQTVATGAAPKIGDNRGDIVSHKGYGKDGISDSTFLPYSTSTASGAIHRYAIRNSSNVYTQSEQYLFYQGTEKVASDTRPFALSIFRATPDARITEQGAPGLDWQPSGGHAITSLTTVNTNSYPVRYWKSDGTTSGNYTSKSVIVSITTDENGNKVRTYTNKLGQTVLKQVELGESIGGSTVSWLDTYYVYDDYGQLKYQVPPKAVASLDGTPNLESDTDLDELIFKYTYDSRGRLIEKKEPGAAVKYMVYDIYDRLVLTQDGNLDSLSKWAYVKYDVLGRTVYTGLYTNSRSRTSVQKWVDKAYTASSSSYPEANYVEYKQSGADSLHGYSNVSFPNASDSILFLSVAYFDNYDFNTTGTPPFTYDASHISGLPASASASVRGMSTGSKIRLLSTNGNVTANWLKGVVFYDSFDRVIQTQNNNHLDLNATDKSSMLYSNIRRVEKTKLSHTAQSVTTHITQRHDYDHAGRVLKTYHQVNSETEVVAAQYEYNALGQLVDKKLHSVSGSPYLQSIDFRYNIRGWLQSINNAQLSNDSGTTNTNDETGDYFGMELAYNTTAGTGNSVFYNGNIGAIKWKSFGDAAGTAGQRSYNYSYDKSDKLKSSTFKAYNDVTSDWTKEANTLNESMTYDHNGNILSLTRKKNARSLSANVVTSAPSTIDTLTYTYAANTNRISKVEDGGTTEGFNDGTVNGTSEYTYSADGSLNKDENKGISSITYNFLGKPQVVTYTSGKKVEYAYDAAGSKLTMKVWQGSTLESSTNYSAGFVYAGSTPAISFFSSPEGRVVKSGASYEYQYAIADHQGNTRVLFTSVAPSAAEYLATYEVKQDYGFIADTSKYVPFNSANHTEGGSKVFRMNQGNPMGPGKSLKVYPGDKVDMEVYAYFENGSGYGSSNNSLSAMITAVAAAFGGVNGAGGESGMKYDGISSAMNGFGLGPNPGDSRPSAFINYILFDAKYKVVDMGWTVVPSSASFSKQRIEIPQVTVKEAGYVFVYLSYEDQSNNFVYFDDFKVSLSPSRLVQGNEYYPYGMQAAYSWNRENTVINNFLNNGGTELNQVTQVYDLYYRNYDPVLGRFGQLDPMAGKYGPVSPYHFGANNPVTFNDPLGDEYDAFSVMDGGYVATGHGESTYRDSDPSGRHTTARIIAQSLEGLAWMRFNQFLNGLLSDGGIFSQAWNSIPSNWDGGAASFSITDGQISGFDIWKITISTPKSEEQLIAQSGANPPGWGVGPIMEPDGPPIDLPVNLRDPTKVLQNTLDAVRYANLVISNRLPDGWATPKVKATGKVSMTDLFDFKSVKGAPGWTGTGWQQGEQIFNFNRGGDFEISIQEVNFRLGNVGFDDKKRMIFMNENPCESCAMKPIFWIKFIKMEQALYERAKAYIFK